MIESPLQYPESPLALVSSLMPVAVSEGRHRELFEAVRIFALKPGESVHLKRGEGRDCLQLNSGKVLIKAGGGTSEMLLPEQARTCHYLFPAGQGMLEVRAEEPSLLCHIDQEKFDFLVLWESLSRSIGADPDLQRRMRNIHDSLIFQKLPAAAVQEAVTRMTEVAVQAGDEIVSQYAEGDAFYVIQAGTAEVWRGEFPGDDPELIVEIGPGDAFGEEALITGKQRSATVRMTSDGQLLKLDKTDFNELISASMIREVSPAVAKAMLADGYRLLDVRWEEEFDESYIPGARLLPLGWLRERTDELEANAKYVVYCRSGKRSAVGALVLTEHGIDAVSMQGGILDWPYETESNLPPPPPKKPRADPR